MRDGEYVRAYHEIHEINRLSSVEHIIATVDSVIQNNLKYKNDDTVLTDVFVSCTEDGFTKAVIDHYKENPVNGIRIEDI